ncbi:PhoH family protein [Rubritalea tangerina]|uniref:PhoH-like protein n=2 Tax=Rubritalea tangerina TaxID=430798 RepID=A0ABW4Z6T3_9BACT
MDMIEERLEFETPQFVHALFANETRQLSYIDEKLGVKVVTREGWILLRGDALNVEKAKRAILDLEEARRSGSEITGKDFRTAIDVAAAGGGTGVAQMGKIKLLGTSGRKPVVPRTPQQVKYVQSMAANDVVFGLGPAGTGKTYLAMAMALSLLKAKKIHRIVLTRPAVEAGEALGFLPGDLQEKVAPYLRPLYDAMHDMLDPETGKRYMEDGTIEIAPLAYMRGRTLANSFVILDEAQNTTPEQLFMLLTRIGEGSHCVVTGDTSQIDLKKGQQSGLIEAQAALKAVESVEFIRFSGADVVRHPVVARIIEAYDAYRG